MRILLTFGSEAMSLPMTEEMEVKPSDTDYISEVCDFDREGLRHLGHHLLSLLDWRSLVRLKRACPQVDVPSSFGLNADVV